LSLKKLTELYQQIGELEAAARWREELKARTDDNAIVAEVLGVEGDELLPEPNLIENAGFEQGETSPLGWGWSLMAGSDVWNEAAFFGGVWTVLRCAKVSDPQGLRAFGHRWQRIGRGLAQDTGQRR